MTTLRNGPSVMCLLGALVTLASCTHRDELDALRAHRSDASSSTCTGSTDPAACGATCEVCTTSVENALASCEADACSFRCSDGYLRDGDACVYRPSCVGQSTACGGADCCASVAIAPPTNLTFRRSHDGAGSSQDGLDVVGWQDSASATVTLDGFAIDVFEVSVSRFRHFVEGYDAWRGVGGQNPRSGLGCHPAVPDTSCWRTGWSVGEAFDGQAMVPVVPTDAADLVARITSCGSDSNFTAAASDREDHPINCVSFWEAFMFCVWDGGRLPTEAEWNFAASGGALQRAYPWSEPAPSLAGLTDVPEASARYNRADAEGTEPVHARPAGASLFGTEQMAGNVWEWIRDTVDPVDLGTYTIAGSNPIALAGDLDVTTRHGMRGGSYKDPAARIRTAYRETRTPIMRLNDTGFRCAH